MADNIFLGLVTLMGRPLACHIAAGRQPSLIPLGCFDGRQ